MKLKFTINLDRTADDAPAPFRPLRRADSKQRARSIFRTPHSALRIRNSVRAFTMVEIALSLAIIGFALVAIIGVLPAGLSVQKDNREQSVINLDAAYLMDAIRSGARGQDNLTNFIVAITNTRTLYNPAGGVTNWFTTMNSLVQDPGTMATVNPGNLLTNGFNIVGLLTQPKYGLGAGSPGTAYSSNTVTAVFRAINGPAMDQGRSQTSRDFSFTYLVTIEIVPVSNYAYRSQNQLNYTAPTILTNLTTAIDFQTSKELQANLYDLRLTFRWPLLPNGQLGGGRRVYRTSVSGTITGINDAMGIPGLNFNFLQPQTFLAQ